MGYCLIEHLTKPPLKSLVILTIWLSLIGAIYSRIAPFFFSRSHFFSQPMNYLYESKPIKQIFKLIWIKVTDQIAVKWKQLLRLFINQLGTRSTRYLYRLKKSCIWAIEFCSFKMDVKKWWLNVVWYNFVLKSFLWFQIKLTLRTQSFFKSCEWFRTKLHRTRLS